MRTAAAISIAIMLAALSAGCSMQQMQTLDPEQPLPTGQDIGIVVGSITGVTAEHYWEVGMVPYASKDGAVSGWFASASKLTHAFWHEHSMTPGYPGPDPGLEAVIGRVFAVALPAGSYQLFPAGKWHEGTPVAISPATFEVVAGAVQYISRIELSGCVYHPKNRRTWRGFINASVPAVVDKWDVDRQLLYAKYPQLRSREISLTVIDASAWQGRAARLESSMETDCQPE